MWILMCSLSLAQTDIGHQQTQISNTYKAINTFISSTLSKTQDLASVPSAPEGAEPQAFLRHRFWEVNAWLAENRFDRFFHQICFFFGNPDPASLARVPCHDSLAIHWPWEILP